MASYNLRYDSRPDNITVQQSLDNLGDPLKQPAYLNASREQPWSTRRIKVAQELISDGVVLAGFQEALVRQVHDLAELLGDDWAWIGVGRDDGVGAGEFCPIFYRRSLFTLVSYDSFWLSKSPFEPSKYPGAGCYRNCTAAHFLHSSSLKPFTYFNTHLDDRSDDQRKLAASLLLIRGRYEAVNTKGPVLVTGDFNSSPTGKNSGAYKISTGQEAALPVNAAFAEKYAVSEDQLPDFKFVDMRAVTPRFRVSTNYATYTDWNAPNNPGAWARIDFVFGGSNGGWKAGAYKVGTSLTDDGVLASDHRPILVDVSL